MASSSLMRVGVVVIVDGAAEIGVKSWKSVSGSWGSVPRMVSSALALLSVKEQVVNVN